MNKKLLAEFGLIAIAMIMLFKAIDSIISVVISVLYGTYYGLENGKIVLANLVYLALYTVCFFILLRNRHKIADFIERDEEAGSDGKETSVIIAVSQQQLLYIVLIGIGIVSLLSSVSSIVNYAVTYFSSEVHRETNLPDRDYGSFKSSCVKTIFALLILYFARSLATFFNKTNHPQPTFEFENDQAK